MDTNHVVSSVKGTFDIRQTVGYAILSASRIMTNKMNTEIAYIGENMTVEQCSVLYFISQNHNEDMIQQDIAEMMDKNKSAILRTIDLLEKKGLVSRRNCIFDRRRNLLTITPAGQEVVEKMTQLIMKKQMDLYNKLSEEEVETFFRVLNYLKENC